METSQKIKKKATWLSLRFLAIGSSFLLSIFIFAIIANEMVIEHENHLDFLAFQKLSEITSAHMTKLMVTISFFGSSNFLLPAYLVLIVIFLFFKNTRKLSLDVAAIGITSTIILFSLKAIFHRLRPFDPLIKKVNGFSFPSGHSFSSFTFFGLLIYMIWNHEMNRTGKWILTGLFFLCACSIAFSRVYLHVHYASDVVAGFFLCVFWLGISLWLLKKLDQRIPGWGE